MSKKQTQILLNRIKILSIDPGYERIGIAVLEKQKNNSKKDILLFSECFKTDKKLEFYERLLLIGSKIEKVIKKYSPSVLAIESLFFNTNQKTATKVSEARGVIIFQSKKFGLEVCEYTPLQIKIALTGYGRATKEQVDTITRALIDLKKEKMIDDEMDAIATGITCSASRKTLN